jgi:hypothetical protein
MKIRRFTLTRIGGVAVIAFLAITLADAAELSATRTATFVVATADSSDASKATADFVGDGQGDQEEINKALQALPEAGGSVLLMEGNYDIRRVPDKLGGVLIERSNVTLAGQGDSTRLTLAEEQNINVIRILGSGIHHVVVRDLVVDANRAQNPNGKAPPDLEHKHFEFCGIKAYASDPRVGGAEFAHDITIRNCDIRNAYSLGIMMEGANMRCLDNNLGDCNSDCVEILGGPGIIRGCQVEVTGRVHVAIGSDRANDILMQGNIVRVREGGNLDIGFRSWSNSDRHIITGNIVKVEKGGKCTLAMDVRGRGSVVSANNVTTWNADQPTRLKITAGNAVVTGNVLENVVIEVNDETGGDQPIIVEQNVLINSSVEHKAGNLAGSPARPAPKGGSDK